MTNLCETCRKQASCNQERCFKAYECTNYVRWLPSPVSIHPFNELRLEARAYNVSSEKNEGYFLLGLRCGNALTFVQVLYRKLDGKLNITYMHETDIDDSTMKAFEIDLDPDKAYYIRIADAFIFYTNGRWTWYSIVGW